MSIDYTPQTQETTGNTPPADDAKLKLAGSAIRRLQATHATAHKNGEVYPADGGIVTAQVSVMNGSRDKVGQVWTVYKRYVGAGRSYPGGKMHIKDGDPKKSVVLDGDGNPIRVDFFRTNDVDPLAVDWDEVYAGGDDKRRVAIGAAGPNPQPDFDTGPDVAAPHIPVPRQN